ncbi:MAG: diacylglycerol kinase [Bifidobacteriaceae bacterium]|jgi:diacylglycerol kinase family enzyme|nr:diacylglycerol kinase [Bifidobacteriaceae bacterium]
MGPETWTAIGGVLVGAGGVGAAIRTHRALRRTRRELTLTRKGHRQAAGPRLAIVVNPTKVDVEAFRQVTHAAADHHGYGEPTWWFTERSSPGTAQATAAVDAGATLVVAAGGDGTVRAVAGALTGTRVPLGIVPAGTGNLLARNLGIPLAGVPAAMRVALDGRDRRVDVGRITAVSRRGGTVVEDEVFLVIAGLGFDAAMVSDTDPEWKARVGWPAYFMSGMQNLKGPRLKATVAVDDFIRSLSARSIMIGNCGRLPAGLRLLPDARIDDGLVDLAMADVRAGLVGWASLATQVGLQGLGVKNLPTFAMGRLVYDQGSRIHVVADGAPLLQIDGELIGEASELSVRVAPRALTVRVR